MQPLIYMYENTPTSEYQQKALEMRQLAYDRLAKKNKTWLVLSKKKKLMPPDFV